MTESTIDVMSNYNELSKVDLVNAAIAQDKEAFMQAFNDAIASKVNDALEVKKVEIASTLLDVGNSEIENDEVVVDAEQEETATNTEPTDEV